MYDIPIVALSLQVAFVATGLTFPLDNNGVVVGQEKFSGKFFLMFLSLFHSLPPGCCRICVVVACWYTGWVGQISHGLFGSTVAFTWFAAVLASSVVSFPLVVRSFTWLWLELTLS
ncbi:MAG: hypothetical protein Ct9H300mP19_01040 [Dehalococcoidia bacterium]|nr:MAG: hypothetical protein Ct9H300mP19_01040 [Dehalococcoidia bacterium]